MADIITQFGAMERLLLSLAAGYRVEVTALGEDGDLGFRIETERRDGKYIVAEGQTLPLAAVRVVEQL